MAHTLSAHYDTPHGVACAMLLPIAMEYNKPVVADRLAQVAIALAENVRKTLAADFGIGVTGIAGPDGDGVHDVGTVFVALACEDGSFVHPLHLGVRSDRSRIRTVSANYAFDMLRRALCGKEIVASWR